MSIVARPAIPMVPDICDRLWIPRVCSEAIRTYE